MSELVVAADLHLHVTAPDGRSTTVRVRDVDGAVLVDVAEPGVLLRSLPGGVSVPGLRAGLSRLRATGLPVDRWNQDVEVAVRGRVLLLRRHGSWRPAGVLTTAASAILLLLGSVGAVVAIGLRVRSRR